jgi:hypothetical protein
MFGWIKVWAALCVVLMASACDPRNIRELEEGLSTEADVRARFGEPEAIWDAAQGARVLEYNRQPAGYQNYMITIGPDGRMQALRQVLAPHNFEKIAAGMMMEDVRRMLGKPMRVTRFALTRQTHYDWRFREGPNAVDTRIFTGSTDDPDVNRSDRR